MNQSWVPGMFSDGLIYAGISKNLIAHNTFPKLFYSHNYYPEFWEHPPFIIGLQAILFKIFGVSWTSAKLLNLFFNLANVLTIFNFLKKESPIQTVEKEKVAFFAAFILILSYPFLKISRFPNMDIALSFFYLQSFISYFHFLKFRKKKYWIFLGLNFGLALLCKGHPAFFIPFAIGIHLILSKQYNVIFSKRPWIALILGISIFSIWPLILYINGFFYGFKIWFSNQFLNTVLKSRGIEHYDFFIYFKNLLKSTLPWFLSIILLSGRLLNNYKLIDKKNNISFLIMIFFWSILLPLSFIKFKYGHYIAPLFPFMAMGAGIFLGELKYSEAVFSFLSKLVLFTGLVLLIFPLTNKIRRDIPVHKSIEFLKTNNILVKNFGYVYNTWSRWSFVGTVVFLTNYNAVDSQDKNCTLQPNSAYLISKKYKNCFKNNKNIQKLTYFAKEKIDLVLVK